MSEEEIKKTDPDSTGDKPQKEEQQPDTGREAIMRHATEDEAPLAAGITLRKILGGDFLTADVIRKQIGLIILIAFIIMIYISNRYSCQQDLLEIEELKEELKDAKYKALASTSELTEMCRESNVLEMLKATGDSMLRIPTQPPYIINVPENE